MRVEGERLRKIEHVSEERRQGIFQRSLRGERSLEGERFSECGAAEERKKTERDF